MDAKVRITHDKLKAESWVLPESVHVWEKQGWKLDKKDEGVKANEKAVEPSGAELKASLESKDAATDSTAK